MIDSKCYFTHDEYSPKVCDVKFTTSVPFRSTILALVSRGMGFHRGCRMRRDVQLAGMALLTSVLLIGGLSGQQTGGGSKSTQSKVPSSVTPSTIGPPKTVFYMGRVVMDTGMAPPASVAVVRVCNGMGHREAFTSGDGSFSFMMGDRSANPIPDPSDDSQQYGSDNQYSKSNPLIMAQTSPDSAIADCELRAELAGYSSSSIRLDPSMNNSNVGIIMLHRRGKKADGMISVASLEVPSKARKEYEKGSELVEKGNLADAEKSLRKAIDEYPKFAEAWLRLGDLELHRKNVEAASSAYQEAINADASFPLPYLRMAYLSASDSKWEQTHKLSERVISLDPTNFPVAYYYDAAAEFNLKNVDRAENSALQAERLDKFHSEPRVELLLAAIYKAKGSPSLAADHYRAYLKLVPEGPQHDRVKADLAKTEQMAKSQGSAIPTGNK